MVVASIGVRYVFLKPESVTPVPPHIRPAVLESEDRLKQPKPQQQTQAPAVTAGSVEPAGDRKQIREAITLGDFYRDRGEYDNAIREYKRGLSLDPSNAELRDRIRRARNAKRAETAEGTLKR